jgi:transcriptional regulator GlxA family with amidase domain
MARALNFIDRNTNHAVTLSEIARAAQVSRRTCSPMFLKRFRRSPVSYATARRLSVAAEMMASTTLSAKQVGLAVGYRDPSHFTLAFRKRHGASPRKFRTRTAARRKAEWE